MLNDQVGISQAAENARLASAGLPNVDPFVTPQARLAAN